MKLALAQLNPIIGDLEGNAQKILDVCEHIKNKEVNLVLTPELSLWGYPPRDLLLSPCLLEEQKVVLHEITNNLVNQI